MKISLTCNSSGADDIRIAGDYLEGQLLDNAPVEVVVYDDLTIEIDADGSCWEDVPAEIQDAINAAIDQLAEDYGISIEIDSVKAI